MMADALPAPMASTSLRLKVLDDRPPRPDAAYVLYWMVGARRPSWNFALDRALDWATTLKRPLVVLEPLNVDYPWASDRVHQFVVDGMRDNARAFGEMGVTYYPYLEPAPRAGAGLLRALARDAAVVVTDDTPVFLLPSLVRAGARAVEARVEAVDGCGLVPIDAPPAALVFSSAYAFRRYLQRELPAHLEVRPASGPGRSRRLPGPAPIAADVRRRWPAADPDRLDLASLPIDHGVAPVDRRGGSSAARERLAAFVGDQLDRYGEGRNHPDAEVSSGLSPYLHFGHISAHEIVHRVLDREGWTRRKIARSAKGARQGWWGISAPAEAFLDQVVTWRELGYNMSARRPDCATFEALPAWAITTLERHAADRRGHVYSLDEFAAAATADPIWNAAQRQLVREGRIHNYLRMLWGKKILEWTASPRIALDVMIALNDKYALDGRDPNSYSGIGWVLGRYDRPWGPERPVFGTVRYMSSQNTARKLRMKEYLARYGENAALV